MSDDRDVLTRRILLRGAAVATAATLTDSLWPEIASAQGPLAPTPACKDGDAPTSPQTAGPFFKARSPERGTLREPGLAGTGVVLSGVVVTTDCRPAPGVLVDLWQADDRGAYDNAGFRLRGHQVTDQSGRYRFETIAPGRYPGRTPHFHVRLGRQGRVLLTTQLYFPGESGNARDGLFDPALLMRTRNVEGGLACGFDFVLAMR